MSRRKDRPKAPNGMGSVRWREDRQCYEAAVTVGITPAGNPKRIYASFTRERDAHNWKNRQLLDLEAGALILPEKATLSELVDRWEANHPHWAPSTVFDRVGVLRRHVLPYLGDKQVASLKPGDVAGLIGTLRRDRPNPVKGKSPEKLKAASEAAIHRVVRHLRACLDYAVSIELAKRNVATGIKIANPAPAKRDRWSIEETRAVLEAATAYGSKHTIGNYVYVALMTGMRREELTGLRWADIDQARSVIHVRQVVTDVNGTLHYGAPKTDASERIIHVDAGTIAALDRQQAVQAALITAAGTKWEVRDLVFTNRRGGPIRYKQLRHHFDKVAASAGVSTIRLYDTRSTHGSILAETGVNPKAISERLGHTDVGFTMRTYVRTGANEQRAIAEAMGALGPPQHAATEPDNPEPEGRGNALDSQPAPSETPLGSQVLPSRN